MKRELNPNPETGKAEMEALGLKLFDLADRAQQAGQANKFLLSLSL